MFCDLSYRQDKRALEGLEKDGETIFQRIRQRQEREEKQALCLYTVGRRRRRSTNYRNECVMARSSYERTCLFTICVCRNSRCERSRCERSGRLK